MLPTRKTVQFRREKCPIAPRGQSRSLIRLAGGRLAIPQANRTGGLYRALGVVFSHSQALDGSNLRISVNGCSLRTGRNLHRGRRNHGAALVEPRIPRIHSWGMSMHLLLALQAHPAAIRHSFRYLGRHDPFPAGSIPIPVNSVLITFGDQMNNLFHYQFSLIYLLNK